MLVRLSGRLWISGCVSSVAASAPHRPSPAPPLPAPPNSFPIPTLAPAASAPRCSVLGCSSLLHPPQPTLPSSGVRVALLWLLATGLSAEQAGISGFQGGEGREERRAGFLGWNHLETPYLGVSKLVSTRLSYFKALLWV